VSYLNPEYTKYGSNTGKLIILTIFKDGYDGDAKIWDQKNKPLYPSISGDKGGRQIEALYGIVIHYHIMLIAPNRKIVEKRIDPYDTIGRILQKWIGTNDIKPAFLTKTDEPVVRISDGKIKLALPADENCRLTLFSSKGQAITKNKSYNAVNNEIFIQPQNGLSKGLYFIQIQYDNKDKIYKLVIR